MPEHVASEPLQQGRAAGRPQCRGPRRAARLGGASLLAWGRGRRRLPLSHQLSASELSVPARCRGQPPARRGRGSWQEGGITHLEADLGSPDPEPRAGDQLRALPFTPLQVPIAAVGLQAGR